MQIWGQSNRVHPINGGQSSSFFFLNHDYTEEDEQDDFKVFFHLIHFLQCNHGSKTTMAMLPHLLDALSSTPAQPFSNFQLQAHIPFSP
jgi:hypothetical protein